MQHFIKNVLHNKFLFGVIPIITKGFETIKSDMCQ